MIKISILEKYHLEELRFWRNTQDIWQNFSNPLMLNEHEQLSWYERQNQDPTKRYFVILDDDVVIGSVWMDEWDKLNRSCRVGIFIIPPRQRQGIGYDILNGFLEYLFNDLNIHRAWLLVLKENIPAAKLYEKCGFKKEGVQRNAIFRGGRWHHYIQMSLIKNE